MVSQGIYPVCSTTCVPNIAESPSTAAPSKWGYTVVSNGTVDTFVPASSEADPFQLLMLGKRKTGRPNPVIPDGLAQVVDKQENVSFKEVREAVSVVRRYADNRMTVLRSDC